jgi:hypothetical protein
LLTPLPATADSRSGVVADVVEVLSPGVWDDGDGGSDGEHGGGEHDDSAISSRSDSSDEDAEDPRQSPTYTFRPSNDLGEKYAGDSDSDDHAPVYAAHVQGHGPSVRQAVRDALWEQRYRTERPASSSSCPAPFNPPSTEGRMVEGGVRLAARSFQDCCEFALAIAFPQGEIESAGACQVSLVDRISQARLKMPVRGFGCKHLEAFELATYEAVNKEATDSQNSSI